MLRKTMSIAIGLMLVGACLVPAVSAKGKPAKKPNPSKFQGTSGNDTYAGTDKRDKAWGRAGNDLLSGLGANDRLWGGLGDDSLDGGDGNDRLWTGPGTDTAAGGAGDDRIFAAADDGAVDTISCGDGADRVVLRTNDIAAADCEKVTRVGTTEPVVVPTT